MTTVPLATLGGQFRGAWQANTQYYTNDLVTQAGALQQAITQHVSGAAFNAGNWNQLSVGSGASYPGATLLVAASNSSAKAKAAADYLCTGTNDDATINTALTALPAVGGVVLLAEGDYYTGNTGIQILASNRHLWGMGWRDDCRLHVPVGATPPQIIQVASAGTGNLNNNTIARLGLTYDNFQTRYVHDLAITGGTTGTSATAAFTAADTGKTVTAPGVPLNTTITYVNATTVTLSQAATNATGLSAGFTTSGMTGHGIVASSNMFRVQDVYVANIPQDGIRLSSFSTPLEFAEQSILNTRLYSIGRDGIVTTSDIDNLVCQNVRASGIVWGGGRYGFNLAGSYAELVGCRANDFYFGWGINCVGTVMTKITGGHYDENGGYALTAGNGRASAGGGGLVADANSRVDIAGARFNNNDSFDVYFSATSNSQITGCQSFATATKGPSKAFFYITGSNNVTIANNNLVDSVSRGITIASATAIHVHDNTISQPTVTPTQASIQVYASDHCNVHHNSLANGFSEENTSNNNNFEQNYVVAGPTTVVGAQTVSIPFLTNPSSTPVYEWTVAGYLGWGFDEAAMGSSGVAPTAQNIVVSKVQVPVGVTINNVNLYVVTAGAGLTVGTQNVAVIYDSAGNLLAQSVDQSTAWTTTGPKACALTAPLTVTGGATKFIYVGMLAGGTTLPAIGRSLVAAVSSPRWVRTSSGPYTAAPAGPLTINTNTNPLWFGIS